MPASTGSRGSSMPITPVDATPTCAGSIPSASAASPCIARAVSRPRSPSPTFEQPEFATTARSRCEIGLARDDHRSAHARVGGEARGRHRLRLVAEQHADVEALGLDPGSDARRAEARGQRGRVELASTCGGRVAPSASGRSVMARPRRSPATGPRPSASGRPSIRLRSCTACPAAPFQRLSIAANTSTRPGGRLDGHVDAADVRVAHLAHAGRRVGQLHERLVGVGGLEQLDGLRLRQLRRDVTAGQQALVDGQQVRRERHREALAELLLELAAVAVALDLVRAPCSR